MYSMHKCKVKLQYCHCYHKIMIAWVLVICSINIAPFIRSSSHINFWNITKTTTMATKLLHRAMLRSVALLTKLTQTEILITSNIPSRERTDLGTDSESQDWIGLCSVLRPRQHSIGYMGDGSYRSKDSTNSIKVLKEMLQRKKQRTKTTKSQYRHTIIDAGQIWTDVCVWRYALPVVHATQVEEKKNNRYKKKIYTK